MNLKLNYQELRSFLVKKDLRDTYVCYRFRFNNNYGVTIIKGICKDILGNTIPITQSSLDDLWSLCLLEYYGNDIYDTRVTDYILEGLTEEEVFNELKHIQSKETKL